MDYKKIGLKVGLEIHFQINTNKLFCKCHSVLRDDEPNIKVERKLHAVPSEFGERDVVAEYELAKNKYAIYECYDDTTCLVELDESPPEKLNDVAFKTALEVAMLLKCKIVDVFQVMRKQVLDYSNTSGFQRSGLIARDGYIETSSGRVRIQSICLEEDAARKIKETNSYLVYRLDRLGIPLIEISTAPDIKTPEQAKEVAEYIGMIVKSTGKRREGIGTIRQDLNVSINKGDRVEIKGVQDLRSIPRVIENEVKRQLDLVNKGEEVISEVRNANLDNTTSYLRPMPGAARLYPETDVFLIRITKEMLSKIKIPELLAEKIVRLEKEYNLNSQLAREIIKRNINLERCVKNYKNVKPELIAHVLIEIPKEIKTRYNLDIKKIKEKDYDFVLSLLDKGEIERGAVIEILVEIAQGKKIDISKYKRANINQLEKEIKGIVEKNKGLSINALMGIIMKDYKGKIDGKEVMRILKKLM